MKLPIKKKYFDEIKSGKKDFEYRDAHITFICEETGEKLRKDIVNVFLVQRNVLNEKYNDILEDKLIIAYKLWREEGWIRKN